MARELKNVLINRLHDRRLEAFASKYFSGRLIDIGCGLKPYGQVVAPFVREHVGLDHAQSPHGTGYVDFIGTAYAIPQEDGCFDSALCTSVLEHLEEPEAALRECFRVLRPGGMAIYSVPFIWHLHEEPRDFFRFSEHGLRYLFDKTGFDVVEMEPLTGFWGTFGQMLVYKLYRFNRGPLRVLRIIDALGLAIQGVSWSLDRIDRSRGWPSLYMVVARKR